MYCKSCGNNCNENAIACTSCGIPPKKGKLFCGDCGEKTNENAIICVKCGKSFSGKKIKETKKVDIKSFSSLKKFTIVSVLGSIILLFLPWVGEISPINLVEFKNDLFDIVDIDDLPLSLNLLSNLGYITIFFLLFTIFKIYKSSYNFASILQFINIVILVLLVSSNIFYAMNGEYKDWIEDEYEELEEDLSAEEKEDMSEDYFDLLDDYGIEDVFDDHGIKELYEIFRFTPILFLILFITNWILIGILSRRKRLEIIKQPI